MKLSGRHLLTRSAIAVGVVGLALWAVGLFTTDHHTIEQIGFSLFVVYYVISVIGLLIRQNKES